MDEDKAFQDLADDYLGPADAPTNEEPSQTEPASPEPVTPESPAEPAGAEPEPVAVAAAEPLVEEAPAETPGEEEYEPSSFSPSYGEVPPLDFSSIPQNEDGTLDAEALADAMQKRDNAILRQSASMVQQAEERREEEKLWNKAFEAHPELRSDKSLAEDVNAIRFGKFAKDVNDGKVARMMTPAQAYKHLQKRFSEAKAEGQRQATASITVQESAYVEPSSNASSANSKADNYRKIRSSNRAEAEAAQDAILDDILGF